MSERLAGRGFRLIELGDLVTGQRLKCYPYYRLTELNLENFIEQAFQIPAVEIPLNPYQGLKQRKTQTY